MAKWKTFLQRCPALLLVAGFLGLAIVSAQQRREANIAYAVVRQQRLDQLLPAGMSRGSVEEVVKQWNAMELSVENRRKLTLLGDVPGVTGGEKLFLLELSFDNAGLLDGVELRDVKLAQRNP